MGTTTPITLDPADVAGWAALPYEALFALTFDQVEAPQLEALARRFEMLRPGVVALDKLATRQGVDRIESLEGAAPLLFDHRVYKSYPISLVEHRQFDRLTAWLQRLTTHDLGGVPLDDVTSVDAWLDRLDEHGMIMLHSTGTTGKLSFLPRSRSEWPAWENAFFKMWEAATGIERREVALPTFWPGYRLGHSGAIKMCHLFAECCAEGEEGRHVMYDYAMSSDLMSLAGRLRTAEERGELDQLDIDPQILADRAKLIEAGRHREDDFQRWFTTLAQEFRGQRVWINAIMSDLIRLALKAGEQGFSCDFAPGTVLFTGGGLKGLKDPPADWEAMVKRFFSVDRLASSYGMSECMGNAPSCSAGFYHLFPFVVPLLLDPDGNVLPREGTQTGRLGLFDLLAESYWGGFLSGDQVTLSWDEDCACGWKGPRVDRDIRRFSEMEGGDDKISCAGTEEAYSEFMAYVSDVQ